jgi:hypothetical protein
MEITDAMVDRAWKVLDDALNKKHDGTEYCYGDHTPMRVALEDVLGSAKPDDFRLLLAATDAANAKACAAGFNNMDEVVPFIWSEYDRLAAIAAQRKEG